MSWRDRLRRLLGEPSGRFASPLDQAFLRPDDEDADAIAWFIGSIHAAAALPPGPYAMWWATDEGQRFSQSACFRSWGSVYHTLDGIETWAVSLALRTLGALGNETMRVTYPPGMKAYFVEGPMGEPLVLSLSQEKGIRFHFNAERCPAEYRDRFVDSFARCLGLLRREIEAEVGQLDAVSNPRALDWWKSTGHAEALDDPGRERIQRFGVVVVDAHQALGDFL